MLFELLTDTLFCQIFSILCSCDFTCSSEQTIDYLVRNALVNHEALKVSVLMWVGGKDLLEDLFLSERILVGDLDHKLAHRLDVSILEILLRVGLNLVEVCFLQGDQALSD